MDLQATYEYVVSPQKNFSYKLKRVLVIIGYIVYALGLFLVGGRSRLLVPLLALVPLTTWILVFFTWRYVSVEYEYSLTGGDMTLSKIYGQRSRKTVKTLRISKAYLIAPFEESYIEEIKKFSSKREIDFTSDINNEGVYFGLFEDENSDKITVYFEATETALKILKYYNRAAVREQA